MVVYTIHNDHPSRQGWPTLREKFDTLDAACRRIVDYPAQYRIERIEYDDQQHPVRSIPMLFWNGKHLHATRQEA